MIRRLCLSFSIGALAMFAACSKESPTSNTNTPGATASQSSDAPDVEHNHDGHDHSHDSPSSAGHGGPVIELGTATIGSFTVRASRDQGSITPGGDAPIDVWLTGGDLATVSAVRFWIGTETGSESVKAKADIEDPAETNHWHTHAEIPSPLPTGSKLWVEIEVGGQKHLGGFDLKN